MVTVLTSAVWAPASGIPYYYLSMMQPAEPSGGIMIGRLVVDPTGHVEEIDGDGNLLRAGSDRSQHVMNIIVRENWYEWQKHKYS